jgi:hypothetical protein
MGGSHQSQEGHGLRGFAYRRQGSNASNSAMIIVLKEPVCFSTLTPQSDSSCLFIPMKLPARRLRPQPRSSVGPWCSGCLELPTMKRLGLRWVQPRALFADSEWPCNTRTKVGEHLGRQPSAAARGCNAWGDVLHRSSRTRHNEPGSPESLGASGRGEMRAPGQRS